MYVTTTFDEVRDTLLQWIVDKTGLEIVLANAGEGPKPSDPYVLLQITSAASPPLQNSTLSADGLSEKIRVLTTMDVQLDFYGGNAMQSASLLARSFNSQRAFVDLYTKFGILNVEPIRDLTALETGSRKQRAQMVVKVRANLADEFDADYNDRVELEVKNDDGSIVYFDGEIPEQ